LENEVVVVSSSIPGTPTFSNVGDTLISNSASNNQWYLNGVSIDGAINNTFIIEENGYYSVEIMNSFTCSSISDSIYMVILDLEPIIKEELSEEIKIYPNPNEGSFTIQFGSLDTDKQLSYEIYDVTGKRQQIGQIETSEIQKEIHLNNPNEGIFIIHIYSN
jgi:hypothetical protein